MTAPLDHIRLDRRFIELGPNARPEDEALDSYTKLRLTGELGLGWDDLLKRRLVVVLVEPGSGKTWEFQQRARELRDEGRFAFFIRLDSLAGQQFDAAVSPGDYQLFRQWLRSGRSATFLLDSVDDVALGSGLKYEIRSGINAAWPASRD